MKPTEVCILGGAGFGGGELLRLLLNHPFVCSIRAVSRSYAGQPFHAAHPNLRGLSDGKFEADIDWSAWDAGNPTVFAALPNRELAGQYSNLTARWKAAGLADDLLVIDLSGDFRLANAEAFELHYGEPHPAPEALGSFVYGLSEWLPERLSGARRIANPGCFATAVELALLPLAGLPALGRVCVSAMTGSSGSGAKPCEATNHATRANDLRAYKVLRHQHLGEIEALLAASGTSADIAFVPHSVPLVRGIFATVHIDLRAIGLGAREFISRYQDCYGNQAFVRMVEDTPRIAAVSGTNFCDIAVHVSGDHGAVLVALDNLGKGMAGQAVQNLNLANGWELSCGLRLVPAFPA